ncbi:MAG: hypothetical protein JO356_08095, partial [Acidobacteria bacterium]|nr:hypothetical protein [Acidobacteriota bacterium]
MQEEITAGFWLSPQQKFVWNFEQQAFAASSRALGMISVSGTLDPERLEAALKTLVSRHESLHTIFRRQAGMKLPF